jgi:hypothetical protein
METILYAILYLNRSMLFPEKPIVDLLGSAKLNCQFSSFEMITVIQYRTYSVIELCGR